MLAVSHVHYPFVSRPLQSSYIVKRLSASVYFIIALVVVVFLYCMSDNQKVVCVTCNLRSPRQPQLDGNGFKFHTSPRQAFLRRQKLMQYDSSCANIHNTGIM